MEENEAFRCLNCRRLRGKSATEFLGLLESSDPYAEVNEVLRCGFDYGR